MFRTNLVVSFSLQFVLLEIILGSKSRNVGVGWDVEWVLVEEALGGFVANWVVVEVERDDGRGGTPVSAQTYLQERCADRGNYAPYSKYQDNLDHLLSGGLDNKGPIYGFYNTTEGEDPDKVYGLFLCRGDVAANLCQSCIDSATSLIIERCPGQKEAIIWYDECLVRYSNRSFFSIMETMPVIFIVNPADVEQTFDNEDFATAVTDLARNVTDLAISSKSLYATININVSSSVTLHELAQCTPRHIKVRL
ncbi:hypothetical protein NL676_008903 [Syzygium grande]|nr:hypothetical protein NL676_008903 [Syzygium grande]